MNNNLNHYGTSGLSGQEALNRLKKYGYNELPSAKKRNIFVIAFEVAREPMFLLLVACGVIYLLIGDVQEAAMLLGFVFIVMGITFYQERKTERALEALRDLSSPRALVIRDGEQKRIAGREVVVDDIMVLREGDRIPADAVLMDTSNFMVDESLLTGESAPVRKAEWDGDSPPCIVLQSKTLGGKKTQTKPGGDDLPFIFSGTLVVQGHGIAKVTSIGAGTEIGKIGKALQQVEVERTPLQKEIRILVRNLALLGLGLCALVVITYGVFRGSWLSGFLSGITLAMAILPEEFPAVFTIFLALGAWRISRNNVLTRRVPAVETLGAATVLCVDKTGTITMNQMSVNNIFAKGEFFTVDFEKNEPLPENFHELLEFSLLASQVDPFDPMEKALKQFSHMKLSNTGHIHNDWILLKEYPLSKQLLAISHVWKSSDGQDYIIAVKGSPEAIMDLCHFNNARKQEIHAQIEKLAEKGLRVIGAAKAYFSQKNLPGKQHDFNFEFLGLIGFTDPVRPTVPLAIKECYNAGIRVIMITGDYPGTAQKIARQIGLANCDRFITGEQLEKMDKAELKESIKNVNLFVRTVPEQKLQIINALKANSEVVAMTGDGVNDAPALKSAHIGIAMGERGTDVAREAAALVLLDDDFSSIVKAVRIGRRIFENLKKAMSYIFAVHVPIAGISLLPVFFNWPLVLMPVHVVFLELIIDPACSVVFESNREEEHVMSNPPRRLDEPLFGKKTVLMSLLQGLSVLLVVLAVFGISNYIGHSEAQARALTFTTLIVANLGLILVNLSWSSSIIKVLRTKNKSLWWILGGTVAFLFLVLYVPFLRNLFKFSPLHAHDLFICLSAGIVSVLWFELLKMFRKRQLNTI